MKIEISFELPNNSDHNYWTTIAKRISDWIEKYFNEAKKIDIRIHGIL